MEAGDPMSLNRTARFFVVAGALLAAACASAPAPSGTVELRVLAINDFHGYIDAPDGGTRVLNEAGAVVPLPGGGSAARLATLVAQRRALSEHSIMVSAGDLIGASQLISALFHDEPTIEAMDQMGLSLSAVGNHEFDEGPDELLRMQNGGCHANGCVDGLPPFNGADFQYLAASTIVDATGQTLFPASAIRAFDGVRVGFIGLTLEATPSLVTRSGTVGLTFRDEIETINAEAGHLRAQGVEAIVVLIHEGGARNAGAGDCPGLSGDIVGIVQGLDASVDVVVSGHTNGIYICRIGDILLTSAGQYAAYLTEIVLTLDRRTGDVADAAAQNIVVAPTLAQDAGLLALIEPYRPIARPMAERVAGYVAQPLPRDRNEAGESPMGLVIADSMLAAAERIQGQRPDIAFMNPGGVRASIARAGAVNYEQVYNVQPFGNILVVFEMTGAEIETLLAQQFRDGDRNIILHVSEGSGFVWRRGAGGGALVPGSVRINGERLDPSRTYRVATNNFLAEGGDGFEAFRNGRPRDEAGFDIDALEAYLPPPEHPPLPAPSLGRVRLQQ